VGKLLKVEFVERGSQAESLGILAGDVVVSYDGTPVSTSVQLTSAVGRAKDLGKKVVPIRILRNGSEIDFDAVPGKMGFNVEAVEVEEAQGGNSPGSGTVPSEYSAAKMVSGFVAVAGWLLVALGAVSAVFALEQTSQAMQTQGAGAVVIALIPSLISVGVGFLLVMGAQLTRAVVDTADYAREILKAVGQRDSY